MTEFIGDWMRSIASTALICSAALTLTPKGKVKSALQLICGLLLICAVISPIAKGDTPELSMSISEYRRQADELTAGAQKNSNELSRTIIEDELEAYILDKAKELGEGLQSVELEMRWSSEGYWYPESVTVRATGMGITERSRLENLIEVELGIPAQRQYWSDNES